MHLDVHELIWFKHGLIKDFTELYILIAVKVILTCIQGHRAARKQIFLPQLPHIIKFGWNLVCCWNLFV